MGGIFFASKAEVRWRAERALPFPTFSSVWFLVLFWVHVVGGAGARYAWSLKVRSACHGWQDDPICGCDTGYVPSLSVEAWFKASLIKHVMYKRVPIYRFPCAAKSNVDAWGCMFGYIFWKRGRFIQYALWQIPHVRMSFHIMRL